MRMALNRLRVLRASVLWARDSFGRLRLRVAARGDPVVFVYHGVVDRQRGAQESAIHLPLDDFAAQIGYLHRSFDVVPLSQFIDHVHGRDTLGGRCASIAFDDGYENNLTCAKPVLDAYAMPAAVFACPAWTVAQADAYRRSLIVDLVRAHILFCNRSTIRISLRGRAMIFDLSRYVERRAACETIAGLVDDLGTNELLTWATAQFPSASLEYELAHSALCCPAELRLLHQGGWEIGAHTITHRPLAGMAHDEARNEIRGALAILRERIGCKVDSFAYPHGSFNGPVTRLVSEAGFKAAWTIVPNRVSRDSDPFALPRVVARVKGKRPW